MAEKDNRKQVKDPFAVDLADELNSIKLELPSLADTAQMSTEEQYNAWNQYRVSALQRLDGQSSDVAFSDRNNVDGFTYLNHPRTIEDRQEKLHKAKQQFDTEISRAADLRSLPSTNADTFKTIDMSRQGVVKAMEEAKNGNSLYDTWFEDVDSGKLTSFELLNYRYNAFIREGLYKGVPKAEITKTANEKFSKDLALLPVAEGLKGIPKTPEERTEMGLDPGLSRQVFLNPNDPTHPFYETREVSEFKKRKGVSDEDLKRAQLLGMTGDELVEGFRNRAKSHLETVVEQSGKSSSVMNRAVVGSSFYQTDETRSNINAMQQHFKKNAEWYGVGTEVAITAGSLVFPPLLVLDTALMLANVAGVDVATSAFLGEGDVRQATTLDKSANAIALAVPFMGPMFRSVGKVGAKTTKPKLSESVIRTMSDVLGVSQTRSIMTGGKPSILKALKNLSDEEYLDDTFRYMDTIGEGAPESTTEMYYLLKQLRSGDLDTTSPEVTESVVSKVVRLAAGNEDSQAIDHIANMVNKSFGEGVEARSAAQAMFKDDPDMARNLLFDVRASGIDGDGLAELDDLIKTIDPPSGTTKVSDAVDEDVIEDISASDTYAGGGD